MTFTVLTAEFIHESNTFNRKPTDYDTFLGHATFFGEEAILERGDANTELSGFCDSARKYGWNQIHVLSASAEPGGPVSSDAFERLGGRIVAAIAEHKDKLDGILLGLHGAMVTDFCQDGEGEFLKRIRAVVGPDLPIAITLDLHANVSPDMCEHANIIVSYKTYPHVDMRVRAQEAGDYLQIAMRDGIKPVTLRVTRPMLDEINGGRTDVGPMIELYERCTDYEKQPGVFAVSINAGFGQADIEYVGPTVLITHDGTTDKHRAFAESIADEIWNNRFDVINTYYTVEEAAEIAGQHKRVNGPIIVADYADNPGCGAYGDSTNLLKAFIDAGLQDAAFGPMVDPDVARQLHAARIGDTVHVELGGKTDSRFGGGPLSLDVQLISVHDGHYIGDGPMVGGLKGSFGLSAVIKVGGIEVLVVTDPSQMLDLQQFRAFGIDPAAKTIVGLKSMQHFRAAFEPIADRVIVCDSGALGTTHYERLPYVRAPRPIYPLDRDFSL